MPVRIWVHRLCFLGMYALFTMSVGPRFLSADQRAWEASSVFVAIAVSVVGLLVYCGFMLLYSFYDLFARGRPKRAMWLWFLIGVPVVGTYVYLEHFILPFASRAQVLRRIRNAGVRYDASYTLLADGEMPKKRMLASLIDYGLVVAAFALDLFLFGISSGDSILLRGGSAAFIIVLWLCWFPISEALFGRTLGKAVMRLRVIDVTGMPILFRQALTRHLLDPLDVALPVVVTRSIGGVRRRLGDRLAKTLVVEDRPRNVDNLPASNAFTYNEANNASDGAKPIVDRTVFLIVAVSLGVLISSVGLYAIVPGTSEIGLRLSYLMSHWGLFCIGIAGLVVFPMIRGQNPSVTAERAFALFGVHCWTFIGLTMWSPWTSINSASVMALEIGRFEERNGGRTAHDFILAERTDTVQARIGSQIGVKYQIIGAPRGRKVEVKSVWKCPPPGLWDSVGGLHRAPSGSVRIEAIGDTNYIGYLFESNSELLRGRWSLEIWCDNRLPTIVSFVIE